MPKVTYITPADDHVIVEITEDNLMHAAVENGVEGILGDCGGVAACATCHVHIASEWMDKVGPPHDIEKGMLEMLDDVSSNSRLGCQVNITSELDGLILRVVGQ